MSFDYSKLRGKIKEVFGTQSAFAEAMKISASLLSAKLNNNVEFSQFEIERTIQLLSINKEDIPLYFFCLESSES